MNKHSCRKYQSTSGERTEAGRDQQATPGTHRDHDEDDLKAFEQHGFESGNPRYPVQAFRGPALVFSQLGSLSSKDSVFTVQGNDASCSQRRLSQPSHAEEQKQYADYELQAGNRDAVQNRSQ